MDIVTDAIKPLTLAEQEISFYEDEGYILLPNLVEPEMLASLRQETLRVLECQNRDLAGAKLEQSTRYVAEGALDQLVNSPSLCAVASQLMRGDSSLYMPFTAVKSAGGGGRFDFHQDNQYTRHDGRSLNIWVALTDMTPENGCLIIVPRTHLKGTLESAESADADGHRRVLEDPTRYYMVRMRAGDAVVFDRLTVHGSGRNSTSEHRIAYALQFHRNDTKAFFDDRWELLIDRPRFDTRPVASWEEV